MGNCQVADSAIPLIHKKVGVYAMIVFDRLWQTMKRKGITQYKLIHNYGFSTGQLDRLRKNGNINSYTLNTLCRILDCGIDEIMEYRQD